MTDAKGCSVAEWIICAIASQTRHSSLVVFFFFSVNTAKSKLGSLSHDN